MSRQLEQLLSGPMKNLQITDQKRLHQNGRSDQYCQEKEDKHRRQTKDDACRSGTLATLSMDNLNRSDGFLMTKQKWQFFLSPTTRREQFPSLTTASKPEPALTTVMFRIAQNRSRSLSTQDAVTSDRKKPPKTRRLNVNSIRNSACVARNEQKMQMKRANTAREASLSGRSLRTLHQITHVEAIAASELEKRRQEWLDSEEKRKDGERVKLQRKVNSFIDRVEEDKKKLFKLQNKTVLALRAGLEVRGRNTCCTGDSEKPTNVTRV